MEPEICTQMLKKLSEKLRAKFPATTRGYSMVKLPVSMMLCQNFFTLRKPRRRSIAAENLTAQKMHFWEKAPGVNELRRHVEALHTFNQMRKLCRETCLAGYIHSWLCHLFQHSWIIRESLGYSLNLPVSCMGHQTSLTRRKGLMLADFLPYSGEILIFFVILDIYLLIHNSCVGFGCKSYLNKRV